MELKVQSTKYISQRSAEGGSIKVGGYWLYPPMCQTPYILLKSTLPPLGKGLRPLDIIHPYQSQEDVKNRKGSKFSGSLRAPPQSKTDCNHKIYYISRLPPVNQSICAVDVFKCCNYKVATLLTNCFQEKSLYLDQMPAISVNHPVQLSADLEMFTLRTGNHWIY